MTELYIDGYKVVLPSGFKLSLVHENAFLTKNGEYTYDISLSLENEINAKVYKHINRINSMAAIKNRSAILICDGVVLIDGVEIILEITEKEVSLQIVSGNSEFNNVLNSETKIWELELGKEPALTKAQADATLDKKFPEMNYVCAPVVVDGSLINDYDGDSNYTNIKIQPYLLCVMEKVANSMGYPVVENLLSANDLLCKIYIPNGTSNAYASCLPDWTVSEFITETEKFCNAVFVVDRLRRETRILPTFSMYEQSDRECVSNDEVLDEYLREINEDKEDIQIISDNVAYDLPSDDFYKNMNIPDSFFEKVTVETYDSYSDFSQQTGYSFQPSADGIREQLYNKKTIYFFRDIERYAVIMSPEAYGIKVVHSFGRLGIEDDNATILRVIPSKMKNISVTYHVSDFFGDGAVYSQAPSVTNYSAEILGGAAAVLNAQIARRSSNLSVAIYFGLYYRLEADGTRDYSDFEVVAESEYGLKSRYPYSMIDYMKTTTYQLQPVGEVVTVHNGNPIADGFPAILPYTLSLRGSLGMYERVFKKTMDIKTKEIYTFRLLGSRIYDPRKVFTIKHKDFICKQLEYEISEDGLSDDVIGEFYPLS